MYLYHKVWLLMKWEWMSSHSRFPFGSSWVVLRLSPCYPTWDETPQRPHAAYPHIQISTSGFSGHMATTYISLTNYCCRPSSYIYSTFTLLSFLADVFLEVWRQSSWNKYHILMTLHILALIDFSCVSLFYGWIYFHSAMISRLSN